MWTSPSRGGAASRVRLRDRSEQPPTATEDEILAGLDAAFSDLNCGPAQQLAALQTFDHYLATQAQLVVSRYGAESVLLFMHLALHGLSAETRKLAISCLGREAMAEQCELEPLCQGRFLHFLVDSLPTDDAQITNTILKLLSIVISESQDARERLYADDLFGRLAAMPNFAEYNVGEVIYLAVRAELQATEPSPVLEQLAPLLLQLLESPVPDNVCQALKGIETFIRRECALGDIAAAHALLPQLVLHDDPTVVSTAYLVLEAIPEPTRADFAAVVAGLRASGSAVWAVNFLRRREEMWADDPPPELLAALIDSIQVLPYDKARVVVTLLEPALGALEQPVLQQIMGLIGPFLEDQHAAIVRAVLAAMAKIWQLIQPSGDTEWFLEALADLGAALDALGASEDADVQQAARVLLAL